MFQLDTPPNVDGVKLLQQHYQRPGSILSMEGVFHGCSDEGDQMEMDKDGKSEISYAGILFVAEMINRTLVERKAKLSSSAAHGAQVVVHLR